MRLAVPPTGGAVGTRRGRKGYERSRDQKEVERRIDELEEEEESE